MKSTRKFAIALVTAPDVNTARALAQAVLEARLAACVNLVPKVESYFWWQGKIDHAAEVLMLLKTGVPQLAALEQFLVARHPYDTPEFLVLPLSAGNQKYLAWLGASLKG